MKYSYFCCQALQELIRSLWSKMDMPSKSDICETDINQICYDSEEIVSWLANKKYDELKYGNEIETYMPFYYFKTVSSTYYIGGYMLYILEEIECNNDRVPELFGLDHLIDFVISDRFENVFSEMGKKHQIVLLAFVELILAIQPKVVMDERLLACLANIVERHILCRSNEK